MLYMYILIQNKSSYLFNQSLFYKYFLSRRNVHATFSQKKISMTLENIEKDKKLLAELLIRLRHQSRFIIKRYGKIFKYK